MNQISSKIEDEQALSNQLQKKIKELQVRTLTLVWSPRQNYRTSHSGSLRHREAQSEGCLLSQCFWGLIQAVTLIYHC